MDVKKILNHFGIPFIENHSQVSHKCVGIDCPYCSEKNKHCGIFLDNGIFTCWKCSKKGTLYKLIKEIKNISYNEYAAFVGIRHQEDDTKSELNKIFRGSKMKNKKEVFNIYELKSEIARFMVPIAEMRITDWYFTAVNNFARKRNISIDVLKKHGVLYAHSGWYQGRIVIPIPPSFRESFAGVTARDITGTADKRYIFPPYFKAHKEIYPTFKYSSSLKQFVIVEGVFDAWAISSYAGAIAIFGKTLSDSQLYKLVDTISYPKQSEMVVMLDGDASIEEFRKVADMLSTFFKNVTIKKLPQKHDPSSIDTKTLQNLLESHE